MATYTWPDGRPRVELPVDGYLDEILRLLTLHRVVLVQAETGAGKTIRIGQAAVLSDPSRMVYLTQLARNAVRNNGARIAFELGCKPGGLVGWRLFREEPVVSSATRLQLMIDQSLSNLIRRNGGRLPEGLIIVDEAHMQSIPTALLLGMIKEGLDASPNTQVLITSATIDTEKFSRFFDGAPVVSIPGRMYPVTIEPMCLLPYEHHTQAVARVAKLDIDRFLAGTLLVPTEDGELTVKVQKGTIICLQPGRKEIAATIREIAEHLKNLGVEDRVELIEGHADVSPEEDARMYATLDDGKLRIVVGTERLRMSVTIPYVIGVIDSLRKRRPTVNERGVAHIETMPISYAEFVQAMGRPGRIQPGFIQPCSFGQEYLELKKFPVPPIQQAPITSVALQVADLGRSIRNFPFVDPPQENRIDNAILRLQRLLALNEHEEITERGQEFLQFSIDPERVASLFYADTAGCLPEAAIAVAYMEGEGIFTRAKDRFGKVVVGEDVLREVLARVVREGTDDLIRWSVCDRRDPQTVDIRELPPWIEKLPHGNVPWARSLTPRWEINCGTFPWVHGAHMVYQFMRERFARGTRSDFAAIVNAYREFKAAERQMRIVARRILADHGERREENEFPTLSRLMRRWCDDHLLHHKGLRDLCTTLEQLRDDLEASPLTLEQHPEEERPYDIDALTRAVMAGHVDNIARCRDHTATGALGSFSLAYSSVVGSHHGLIVVGRINKPVGEAETRLFADVAAPVAYEWLQQLHPHLTVSSASGDYVYDSSLDRTAELVSLSFLGTNFGTFAGQADTDDFGAVNAFARWLAENGHTVSGAVGEVLEHNRRLDFRAKEAERLGGARINVVPNGDYSDWISMRLGSATSVRTIAEPENLRLPHDVEAQINAVSADFPSTISILGREWPVDYSAAGAFVRFNVEDLFGRWAELPVEGIFLPSGRSISFRVRLNIYTTLVDDRPREIERQAREILSDAEWRKWWAQFRPCPTLEDLNVQFPEVERLVAFEDPLGSAEPRYVYGVVALSGHKWPEALPFKFEWFRIREEAEAARERAARFYRDYHEKHPEQLRAARDVRSGLAIRNFKVWHRRGGKNKNGDGWVIQPDGKLRERDETSAPGKSDGNFTWYFVGSDELALRWTCENTDGVDSTSTFEVVKLPRGGVTTEQLAKVQQIEKELKVRLGSFGITAVIDRAIPTLRVEFYSAVPRCPCCSKALEWDDEMIAAVCSSEGRPLSCCDGDETLAAVFDAEEPCEWRCSGVGAQAMECKPVGDHGEVLTLVFQKGGSWRAALRYRAKDSKRA